MRALAPQLTPPCAVVIVLLRNPRSAGAFVPTTLPRPPARSSPPATSGRCRTFPLDGTENVVPVPLTASILPDAAAIGLPAAAGHAPATLAGIDAPHSSRTADTPPLTQPDILLSSLLHPHFLPETGLVAPGGTGLPCPPSPLPVSRVTVAPARKDYKLKCGAVYPHGRPLHDFPTWAMQAGGEIMATLV